MVSSRYAFFHRQPLALWAMAVFLGAALLYVGNFHLSDGAGKGLNFGVESIRGFSGRGRSERGSQHNSHASYAGLRSVAGFSRMLIDKEPLPTASLFGLFADDSTVYGKVAGLTVQRRSWSNDHTFHVLFFSHWKWYVESNARFFFFLFDTARVHPFIVPTLWGPEFPGWDSKQTVRENIQHYERLHATRFDFVCHELLYAGDLGYILPEFWRELTEYVPVARIHHECRPEVFDCAADSEKSNISIRMYASAEDMFPSALQTGFRSVSYHAPVTLAACSAIFSTGGNLFWNKRDTDVLLTGVSMGLYPLRARLDRLFAENREELGRFRRRSKNSQADPREQTLSYALDLQNTRILVSDASAFRYPLQKYVEAACAGALVIGEIPLMLRKSMREFVVPIDPSQSDGDIVRTIKWWLKHPVEARTVATAGAKFVRTSFTPLHYLELLLDAFEDFERGEYGARFPFDWQLGCHSVGAADGNTLQSKNTWCHEQKDASGTK